MKTGCIIRSYHLTRFLPMVLMNYAWVDKVVVMNCMFRKYPWGSRDCVEPTTDNTPELVRDFGRNVHLISDLSRVWDQSEVFETAKKELLDCDWIFISDADEILLVDDQHRIMEETPRSVQQVCVSVVDYVGIDKAVPIRTHKPLVAIRPSAKFTGTRAAEGERKVYEDIYMHHFGYFEHDDWKVKNLWYPKQSYDEIVCQQHIDFRMPVEISQRLRLLTCDHSSID